MEEAMEKVKEKIERWKILGNLFLKNDTSIFIRKINGDFHFCKILKISEELIEVKNFGPEQRAGKKDKIYWAEIQKFEEYATGGQNAEKN